MASAKKRPKVPDYGSPIRRVMGFLQDIINWKQAKKANSNDIV